MTTINQIKSSNILPNSSTLSVNLRHVKNPKSHEPSITARILNVAFFGLLFVGGAAAKLVTEPKSLALAAPQNPFLPKSTLCGLESFDYSQELCQSHPEFRQNIHRVKKVLSEGSTDDKLDKLQDLAYELFQPPKHTMMWSNKHHTILKFQLYAEDARPSDIASLVLRAQEVAIKSGRQFQEREKAEFPGWHEGKGDITPDTVLKVSHGGGKRFLEAFLSGKHNGYVMEGSGRGIFVTVHHPRYSSDTVRSRDWAYATRTPLEYFDTPTIIKGQIPAKYLKAVNHNSYEAVLMPEDVQKLVVTEKTQYPLRKKTLEDRGESVRQTLPPGRIQYDKNGKLNFDHGPTLWSAVEKDYTPERLNRFKKALNVFVNQSLNRP